MSNLRNPPTAARTTTDPLIRLVNIYKSYRMGSDEVQVLRGVNLEVREGEFVAIMGASGSGKSTLLHIAGALDRPDVLPRANGNGEGAGEGELPEVYFAGRPISRMSHTSRHKLRN